MEDWEKELIENAQRGKSNSHRLDDVEEEVRQERHEIRELTATVKLLVQSVEQLVTSQRLQGERIGALEMQPAEQWKLVTRTIITGVVSALAGGLAAVMLLHVK